MPNYLRHRGNQGTNAPNTQRGPSPYLWADCPVSEILHDPSLGAYLYDDFKDFPLTGTQTTQIAHGRWKVFATTGSSVAPVSAVNSVELQGGALAFSTDTDNDSASLAQSYPSFLLSGLTTTSGKLWFEGEVAVNTIATNGIGFFFGLAETEQWTLATGVPFNGGDAITNSAAAIGFRKEEDGLAVVDTVYSDRATSFTNVGDAEGTLTAAYTFTKYGMIYNPDDADGTVRFYQNGIELASKLTNAQLLALTNLDANAVGVLFAHIADSAGTTGASYLRWVRVAQLYA